MDLIEYIELEEKGWTALSLFDGIDVAKESCDDAELPIKKMYVSEIEKFPTSITRFKHPNNIHLGDVTKWREWDINWSEIDIVFAGSPCQGFSFAGKQLAFDDPRSALFFEFVNILEHIKKINPNVLFFLENVKMKKEFENVITDLLIQEPIQINSSLVSAQNRQRLYWCNWETWKPENKGIMLKDILQDDIDVDDKYYLSDIQIDKIDFSNLNKEFKTDVKVLGHRKGYRTNTQCYDTTGKTGCLDTCGGGGREPHVMKINKQVNLKQTQDKASCLTGGTNSGGNHSDMDLIVKGSAQRGRYNNDGRIEQNIEIRNDDKSNCLTATKYDYCKYTEDYTIRRLTPIECERLQTLPDDYTKYGIDDKGNKINISDTQRYKALGNTWTKSVISHLLRCYIEKKGLKKPSLS